MEQCLFLIKETFVYLQKEIYKWNQNIELNF